MKPNEKLRTLIDQLRWQPDGYQKYSQRKIAEVVGISQPALSDFLRYGKPIREDAQQAIADYLGIKIEDYF